jgi:hypothetical protein
MLSNEVDPTGNMDAHGDDYLNRQVDDIFRDACNQLFAGVCDGVVTALTAENVPLGKWYEVEFSFDETYKNAHDATVLSIEKAVTDYTATLGRRPSVMSLNFRPMWTNVLSSRLSLGMVRTDANYSVFLEMLVLFVDTMPDQSAPTNAFWLGNIDGVQAQFPNLLQSVDRFSYLRDRVSRDILSSVQRQIKGEKLESNN